MPARRFYWTDLLLALGLVLCAMATSFEREASSDFSRSPAQGDRWNQVSTHVPKGRGPFASWAEAAKDAYHIDGLDKIGVTNWTWARAAFEGELFNGFGYRDFHNMHSPYLWGGTNIQTRGKYTADGHFDPSTMDPQLGMMPLMVRMVQLRPALALADPLPIRLGTIAAPSIVPAPQPVPVGLGAESYGTLWLQRMLNKLGANPKIEEDGNYGRMTKAAVRTFEQQHGLSVDAGFAGPQVIGAIMAEIKKQA